MAKIKWGMMVVDGRGKLGGHVLSKNRSGAYARTKVTPVNPQSTFQMAVRGAFASITRMWSTLTASQRQSYDDKVDLYTSTDIFGDSRKPTGKNLFQKLAQNRATINLVPQTVCPNPADVPFANLQSVEGSIIGEELVITTAGVLTGNSLVVLATPPMSPGTKYSKNKLRVIGIFAGGVAGTQDVWAEYRDRFGVITLGDNIAVGVKVINPNGQASPVETMFADIVA